MPRGSNNRLDEAERERDNANRMFDSQNNNRGGYNVGQIYYYQGSVVPMQWTAQHSCGGPNNNCEIIIQYMCDDRVRDGTTTNTIPNNPVECQNYDCDNDIRFGRQESFDWYENCRFRERNKGLFTANQRLQGNSAIFTRQNPAGTRRGYECPEERDYYPYWHPSPWKDIAVLTNQPKRCAAYQTESQNVKSRWYCYIPPAMLTVFRNNRRDGAIPITQDKCQALTPVVDGNTTYRAEWREWAAWNIDAPACRENQWSRDNHLGNSIGGYPSSFNWTVPKDLAHERCVLRIRYNISTGDFDGFASETSIQNGPLTALNSTSREPNNVHPANVSIYSNYKMTFAENAVSFDPNNNANAVKLRASREYVLKNNPKVDIFGSLLSSNYTGFIKLQLAINTAQYGRTFEDRTHRFAVRARTSDLAGVTIRNLQVRGKRGNIVQVFPGVEYDFFPDRLHIANGEYIHIQWTGSNTNPNNNAGQGKEGTDRSNIVLIGAKVYDEGQGVTNPVTYGQFGRSYPAKINDTVFLGFSKEDLVRLATLQTPGGQFGGELSELDDAGTYFDLGPRQVSKNGIYYYLCTRNNNFSNRGQKGVIIVSDQNVNGEFVGWNGGTISASTARLVVPQAVLSAATSVVVTTQPNTADSSLGQVNSEYVSVAIDGTVNPTSDGFRVEIRFDDKPLSQPKMYRADNINGDWQVVDGASFSGGVATAYTKVGGVYAVRTGTNWGAVAGIVIGVVVFVAAMIFVSLYFYRKHMAAKKLANTVAMTKI